MITYYDYILIMNAATSSRRATTHDYTPPATTSRASVPGCRPLHLAGDASLLDLRAVAIIGSRAASEEGLALAADVAAALASAGFVIVSGLAAGIDHAAHDGALRAGGRTIAVIGTSLEQVYPREHARLQERVYRDHLLVSPFEAGSRTARWHFPARNRVMARLSVATVLVEASEESGTRHQVAECLELGRPVYARRGLLEAVSWLRGHDGGSVVQWGDASDVVRGLGAVGATRVGDNAVA
jgi:DNA processing protein